MTSMDPSGSYLFDIFHLYNRYCDIRSRNDYVLGENGSTENDKSPMTSSREALAQLSKVIHVTIESQMNNCYRVSIFDELKMLMSQLNLRDFSEFSRFYDFVFFVCRENGQKNITVNKAVTAWRLVLAGRFRLLNPWCNFIEKNQGYNIDLSMKNQRYNIAEDTWRQVLAFSRCVHENLEGYEPEGAWPVLIDEFVEHMYRVSGSNENSKSFCKCGDAESKPCLFEDPLPGLKMFSGLKRKLPDLEKNDLRSLITSFPDSTDLDRVMSLKRNRSMCKPENREDNLAGNTADMYMEISRHNASKSQCAVEGCLSKGFAGLFTRNLPVDPEKWFSFS